MSIKHSLLALLAPGPQYAYQLRADFEQRTGSTWPLNAGQVYTTLGRLERDGLVEHRGQDDDGHVFYALAAAGRAELDAWLLGAVASEPPPRSELAIKVALAAYLPDVDVVHLLAVQRTATLASLQSLTRRKAAALDGGDVGALVVLDALVATAEAEVRFLDTCERRLLPGKADR